MDLKSLILEHAPELVKTVSEGSDLSSKEAERFVPGAAEATATALGSGGLDLGSLLGGDVSALISKIDVGGIAGAIGIPEDKAKAALGTFLPAALQIIQGKGGGLDALKGLLGGEGGAGALLGAAGKLFR